MMTTEEAIKILDPETRRETLKLVPVHERISADQEACRLAVAALRAQQELESNQLHFISNADCIRSMSDEELAEFLDNTQKAECESLHIVNPDGTLKFESLKTGWLIWLQQPAKEAEAITCAATGQPCAGCQPGPCDHRREEV